VEGSQLHTIASPAPGFAEYMGMEARMVGTEIINGLMLPASLEVKTRSGWKKVAVKGMMSRARAARGRPSRGPRPRCGASAIGGVART
jgi:hypothetical protein